MKKIANILAVLCGLFVGFSGCTPEFDEPPAKTYTYDKAATHTIAQFKAKYNTNFAQITEKRNPERGCKRYRRVG